MASQIPVCLGKIVLQSTGPFSPFQCWKDGTTPVLGAMGDGVWEFTPYSSYGSSTGVPFDASQIDPEICTQLFGAGLMLYLTPWAAVWGLKQIVKAIR